MGLNFLSIDLGRSGSTMADWKVIYCYAFVPSSTIHHSTVHFFETMESRDNSIKYYQREHKIDDIVFLKFEIPLQPYLEKAEKII